MFVMSVFLIVCSVLFVGSSAAVQSSLFTVHLYQVPTEVNQIEPRQARNKLQCATFCLELAYCVAATFDASIKLCSLLKDFQDISPTDDGRLTVVMKTEWCPFQNEEPNLYRGPIGAQAGYDSVSHREYFLSYGCITAIRSWTRQPPLYFMAGIQMRYGTVWAPVIGYSGDDKIFKEVYLEPGEYITRMKWWGGGDADLLEFYTNTGRSLGEHGSHSDTARYNHDFESGLMFLQGKKNSNSNKDTVVDLYLYFKEN